MDKHYINKLMQLRDDEFDLQILLTVTRLIERYPYFSQLYLLKVKAEKAIGKDISESLSEASAFFPNRLKLKEAIESEENRGLVEKKEESNKSETKSNLEKLNQKIKDLRVEIERDSIVEVVPDIIREIDSYKEEPLSDTPTKEELVERFLQIENPKVNKLEDFEEKEVDVGDIQKKSVKKEFRIVTETMANVFLEQGYKDRAIEILEQLILDIPEKSTYFANRIKEIRNN